MNDPATAANRELTLGQRAWRDSWLQRPHLLLLGAGASRAALPNGDANGKKLPVMADFVEVVGLMSLLEEMNLDPSGGIEEIYSSLADAKHPQLPELERVIYDYFDSLTLPEEPTLYDYLVLSARGNDLIATSNWDPFIIQALRRNAEHVEQPQLAFLHGNVWIGYCTRDNITGTNRTRCSKCGDVFTRSKLLYPVEKKNYASDGFIANEWDTFRSYLQSAAFFTIFGYSAPKSDEEAIEAMMKAWGSPQHRALEEFEIIDIRPEAELREQWDAFIHTHHYETHDNYFDSWLGNHPGTAIQCYFDQFLEAQFIDNHPLPRDVGFEELWSAVDDLRAKNGHQSLKRHEGQ